jgi:hypothetical protein
VSLCHHASVLLPLLIACGVLAQEAQRPPVDFHESRIYRIYLAGTPDKPISIRATVEQIESMDGAKVVSKHWTEEWVRDREGRAWGRIRAPREEYPGKMLAALSPQSPQIANARRLHAFAAQTVT